MDQEKSTALFAKVIKINAKDRQKQIPELLET